MLSKSYNLIKSNQVNNSGFSIFKKNTYVTLISFFLQWKEFGLALGVGRVTYLADH
jgi:hypothetical protein